jgi:hypothetical protein
MSLVPDDPSGCPNAIAPPLGDATQDHIFHGRRIDPGAPDDGVEHFAGQICRMPRRKLAIAAAARRSYRLNDVCTGTHSSTAKIRWTFRDERANAFNTFAAFAGSSDGSRLARQLRLEARIKAFKNE